MKKNDLKNDKCCGCKACAYVCPKNAIHFEKDELGFEYPQIDEELCVDCHKCEKNCSSHKHLKQNNLSAYASINQNRELLELSASGGIFSALAELILKQNGVVYGAAIQQDNNEVLKVSHLRIDNITDLAILQGSKYLQSDMGKIYDELEDDLNKGRLVLFSGTPCQTAAVKSIFGDKEKLLLVDIICHGVPSQKMFSEYLSVLRKRKRAESIKAFSFRTKECGWGLCAQLTTENNGKIRKIRIPCNISSYYKMFLRCEIYRSSCYSCPYATQERVSDLTLGDYWGIERNTDLYKECKTKNIDITRGVSCVIASTKKGDQYLKDSNLLCIQSDFDSIAKENGNLKYPSRYPETRDAVLAMYLKQGYVGLEKQFNKSLGIKKYIILLKNRISPRLRMKIKVLLRK